MKKLFQNIPKNWQLSKIGNYTTKVEYGISKSMNTNKIGVPILRMNNLDGEGNIDLSDLKYVDIHGDLINKFRLEKNDVLFNRVNSVKWVGKTSIVKKIIQDMVFASYLIRVNVNKKKLIPDYLNYYLNSRLGKLEINRNLRRASSQANINAVELRKMKIIVPTLAEQSKIAHILGNLNKIIKKTSKLIKSLKVLKKGLMQRLFTEGIGHTEFKETRLGKIPKEWDLINLENLAEIKAGGNAPQGNGYFKNGKYPFVRVQHFNGEKLYVDKWDIITDKAVKDYNLELFPKNAIIFPKSGATINLEKRVLLPQDCYVVGHLCVIIPDLRSIDLFYLFYYLKNLRLAQFSAGSTLPYLNLKFISKIKIPLPSPSEQNKIGNFLSSIDKNVENEQNYLDNLKIAKKGLMQDLLTGKKRVNID